MNIFVLLLLLNRTSGWFYLVFNITWTLILRLRIFNFLINIFKSSIFIVLPLLLVLILFNIIIDFFFHFPLYTLALLINFFLGLFAIGSCSLFKFVLLLLLAFLSDFLRFLFTLLSFINAKGYDCSHNYQCNYTDYYTRYWASTQSPATTWTWRSAFVSLVVTTAILSSIAICIVVVVWESSGIKIFARVIVDSIPVSWWLALSFAVPYIGAVIASRILNT